MSRAHRPPRSDAELRRGGSDRGGAIRDQTVCSCAAVLMLVRVRVLSCGWRGIDSRVLALPGGYREPCCAAAAGRGADASLLPYLRGGAAIARSEGQPVAGPLPRSLPSFRSGDAFHPKPARLSWGRARPSSLPLADRRALPARMWGPSPAPIQPRARRMLTPSPGLLSQPDPPARSFTPRHCPAGASPAPGRDPGVLPRRQGWGGAAVTRFGRREGVLRGHARGEGVPAAGEEDGYAVHIPAGQAG
ncbi:hypothetical protein CALCODRAFT_233206 [Calocera cornea HHB12733]|uniref:Uncharacterized protein n=1 Tax=Calocera cornea HHB12733 TaxID=1353952 RepID=A0A165GWA5_9BASI|nr:hypothetical protein CALCODRAFT_233206 [Calocera cornea HHB12733]